MEEALWWFQQICWEGIPLCFHPCIASHHSFWPLCCDFSAWRDRQPQQPTGAVVWQQPDHLLYSRESRNCCWPLRNSVHMICSCMMFSPFHSSVECVCFVCVCVLNPCVLNVSVETNGANICYFSDLYIETLRNMEATMKRGRSPGLRRQYQTDWPSPPLPPRQAHNTQSSYDTQGTVKRFSSATNDLCLVLKSLIFIWCCQSY